MYLRFKILLQQFYYFIDKVTEQAGAAEELWTRTVLGSPGDG
jgi:hypothetical protein